MAKNTIKLHRVSMRLTQAELARMVGCSATAVSLAERHGAVSKRMLHRIFTVITQRNHPTVAVRRNLLDDIEYHCRFLTNDSLLTINNLAKSLRFKKVGE